VGHRPTGGARDRRCRVACRVQRDRASP